MNEIVLNPEQMSLLISKFESFSVTNELVEKALKLSEISTLPVPETEANTYEEADDAWDVSSYGSDEEKSTARKRLELAEKAAEEEFYSSTEEALLDLYDDCNERDWEEEKMLIIRAMAEKVILAA